MSKLGYLSMFPISLVYGRDKQRVTSQFKRTKRKRALFSKKKRCLYIKYTDVIWGEVNFSSKTATFFLPSDYLNKEDRYQRYLETFKKLVFSYSAIFSDRILLHASGVEVEDGAVCFLGRSRAGKSTTLRTFPYSSRIADDALFVKKRNGCFWVSRSPFLDKTPVPKDNVVFPLKRLYLLKKAENDEVFPILPARAIGHLFRNLIFSFPFDQDFSEKCSRLAIELAIKTPMSYLYFTRSKKFHKIIQNV